MRRMTGTAVTECRAASPDMSRRARGSLCAAVISGNRRQSRSYQVWLVHSSICRAHSWNVDEGARTTFVREQSFTERQRASAHQRSAFLALQIRFRMEKSLHDSR